MLAASTGVEHFLGKQCVVLQVERVADDQRGGLTTPKLANIDVFVTQGHAVRQDQRMLVGDSLDQVKRRRYDVHFAVSDHDIAVAAESFDVLVFMHIPMVGIQKVAMADH
jgi:hypothetical protein